jgi:hypothetical protein
MAFASLGDFGVGYIAGRRMPINKASIATQVAGSEAHLWASAGFPAAGTTPAAAAVCSDATVGALPLVSRSGGQERIISALELTADTAGLCHFVEDRLMHMGGLSGTLTTAQTVNCSLFANLGVSNLTERIGASDYSEVEWFLDWYTATGATIATPTVNVTYHDGTTGTCNVWVNGATALPASVAAGRRYKIVPTNGKFIRSVDSVTLSVSTGTAGNFGVTAVRRRSLIVPLIANRVEEKGWDGTRAAKIPDNACLTFSQLCITTSTRALLGAVHQAVK